MQENQLATQVRPSALAVMASRYNVEPAKLLDTLKATAFKGANDAQMMALCIVANEYGMNPFTKEIYAFPDKSGGIIPVIGVDGWYRRMNDHQQFNGIEFEMLEGEGGVPVSCTAIIYRKDREKATRITEFVSECKRNTDPWNKQPRRMIRHRAAIQCIRVAFGFAGSDPEEAELASIKVVEGTEIKRPRFAEQLTGGTATQAPESQQATADEVKQPEKKPRTKLAKVVEPPPVDPPVEEQQQPPEEHEGDPAPGAEPDPAPPAEKNPHNALKEKLKASEISEEEFLSYLKAQNWGSFSTIFAVPAARVKVVIDDFDSIAEAITGA